MAVHPDPELLRRFAEAFARLQADVQASGATEMTDEEIQAEIDAVRAERRAGA